MNKGSIVEYIDQQRIISAVLLQENKGRLRLLNENNREVSFSEKRLSHISQVCLDTSVSRDSIVHELKNCTRTRDELSRTINIKELWEILHEDAEEIDISTMTLFCFDPPLTADHEAAVIRAFFKDRLYFKFSNMLFMPYSQEQVELKKKQLIEAQKRQQQIDAGAAWITDIISNKNGSTVSVASDIIRILKNYYLFGADAAKSQTAKAIIRKSPLNSVEQLFPLFVKSGIWTKDENIELLSLQIPTRFSVEVSQREKELAQAPKEFLEDPKRRDLTHVPLITIDGQSTMDFDDAISLETTDSGYTLGIHIIDVDAYIRSGDPIDTAARGGPPLSTCQITNCP